MARDAAARRPRVLFVRHGESCANVLAGRDLFGEQDMPDPDLTAHGVAAGRDAARRAARVRVDVLFCSPLARAIETAFFMFAERRPALEIRVAPFLREYNPRYNSENVPLPPARQRVERLERVAREAGLPPDAISRRVVLPRPAWARASAGDLPTFLAWLAASDLPPAARGRPTVAVVTHSSIMMRDLGLDVRPLNNAVLELTTWPDDVASARLGARELLAGAEYSPADAPPESARCVWSPRAKAALAAAAAPAAPAAPAA
jgi:hypothetical protein